MAAIQNIQARLERTLREHTIEYAMARTIRNFVDRKFIRTVDLQLLDRFLELYRSEMEQDLSPLPSEAKARRTALYDLFRLSGDSLPDKLKHDLHCLCRVASHRAGSLRLR